MGDASGSPQAGVILDGDDDFGTRDLQNFLDLVHIIPVGVLGPRGKADAGHEQPLRLLHLLHHRDQVGHVIEKIIDPPDIHVPGELPHRQADNVFGIMAVAEQAGAPAHGLEQGPGHGLPGDAQPFKGVHLFAHQVHVDGGAAAHLHGKEPRGLPVGRHPHRGHGHEPVFEVRLGHVPLVVAQVVPLGLPQPAQNLGGAHSPDNSSLHGFFPCLKQWSVVSGRKKSWAAAGTEARPTGLGRRLTPYMGSFHGH